MVLHWFIHSLVHSFFHLSICLFIHSFTILKFISTFIIHPFLCVYIIHLLIHSSIHSLFICSFVSPFIPPFIHSPIHPSSTLIKTTPLARHRTQQTLPRRPFLSAKFSTEILSWHPRGHTDSYWVCESWNYWSTFKNWEIFHENMDFSFPWMKITADVYGTFSRHQALQGTCFTWQATYSSSES